MISRIRRALFGGSEADAGAERQFGAIPYRHAEGEIVFLMVTSRRTRRWIFPKGGLAQGLAPADSAAEEAFEEAGVRGRVAGEPAGHYTTSKMRAGREVPVTVEMYPLEVTEQFDDWPERRDRKRRWITLPEARRRLSEPGLVALAEKVAAESNSAAGGAE